ncbi:hypothetical protein Chor_013291 [Crotalus horridus]
MAHSYAPVEAALGPEENFLSLADILMSQERLPGRAEVAWPRLAGVLARAAVAAAPDKALPEGSKLEIPLWLAKGLYDKRRIISVELPKVYKESWRTVFNADASVTFIGRFRHIMDSSQNTFNEDTSALVARLDELERALFQTGQKGLHDFQCWEMGKASQITVSNLIQNYKKRKFTDMDS